jgi:hypothetical protein
MNTNSIHENMETVKKIIFAAKVKGGKFFTQIAAKKYFKKSILSQSTSPITNLLLLNNEFEYSAYGSMINAFKDCIANLNIQSGATILTHPFTPIEIVNTLKNNGNKIVFYSIDVDTLSIEKNNFQNIIQFQKPTLVIHYSINQLLSEIQSELEFLDKNNTQLLVIDNNTVHNSEYFELINSMQSGSYIQLLSDNITAQILHDLTGIEVDRSSVYTVLNFGHDLLNSITPKANKNLLLHSELADTLYQLLFNQQTKKGIMDTLKNSLIKQTLSSQKNLTQAQLVESFNQIYNKTNKEMIPDYIFELINTLELTIDNQTSIDNAQSITNMNSKKLKIQNLIDNHQQKESIVTIPKPCMLRSPTAFHFSSQDQKYWYNTLKYGGLEFYRLPSPHDDLFNTLDDSINDVINNTLVTIL